MGFTCLRLLLSESKGRGLARTGILTWNLDCWCWQLAICSNLDGTPKSRACFKVLAQSPPRSRSQWQLRGLTHCHRRGSQKQPVTGSQTWGANTSSIHCNMHVSRPLHEWSILPIRGLLFKIKCTVVLLLGTYTSLQVCCPDKKAVYLVAQISNSMCIKLAYRCMHLILCSYGSCISCMAANTVRGYSDVGYHVS